MLKRTLLAAGILGMASGANAISVIAPATTDLTLTPQAVGAAGVTVKAQDFTITVTDDIDLNGKSMQIAFSKAPVASLLPATLAVAGCVDAVMADLAFAGVTNGGLTANYTISGNDADPGACVITVSGVHFAAGDLTTAGISATSSFTIIGSGVSTSAAKTVLDLGADQYSLTVGTPANAQIDVNADRKAFVGGGADTIVFTVADSGAAAGVDGVAFGTQEISITGDFSWADNPLTAAFDPTTARQGQTPVAISGGATLDVAKSSTSKLVFDDTNNDGAYTLTLTPLTDANLTDADATNDVVAVAIPVQTYTVSTTTAFNDEANAADGTAAVAAATQVVAAKAAGGHTLNGASTKIFSVPFGAEVESHSIFVANSGTSTGAITGSMVWNGNTAVEFALGNVEAGANKYLNIMSALEALGEKPPFGRADITLTVNAPVADITITAGYTTAVGRANLFMEQQANIDGISSAAKTSAATAATQSTTAATQSTTAATQSTTAATQATASATDAAAAKVQAVCTYAALGEGIDANNAGGTTAATENKYTKTGGC